MNTIARDAPYSVRCPENTAGHAWKVAYAEHRVTQVCRWCGMERGSRRVWTHG